MLAPHSVDLVAARAHWVRRGLIAIPGTALPRGVAVADLRWRLEHSVEGGLEIREEPGPGFDLETDLLGLPEDVLESARHLAGCLALRLPDAGAACAEELLRGPIALVARHCAGGGDGGGVRAPNGRVLLATSLQIPYVLDDIYGAEAVTRDYGVSWAGSHSGPRPGRVPILTVWAPTARQVTLLLWDGVPPIGHTRAWSPRGVPARYPMNRDPDGAWSIIGEPGWRDRCYQFEVTVYVPGQGRVATVRSTDPWSVGLAIDSTHSVLVDLTDPAWTPAVWRSAVAPKLRRAVDQTIYELHVRDFSRDDPEVPEQVRGSYLAFGEGGNGRRHLRMLAEAGLNTVHLLPVFDFTSIEEDPALQEMPDPGYLAALSAREPAGEQQQQLVYAASRRGAFNWGYDPWHFMTPEGSYARPAAAAHGGQRVAQCREMIGALHATGLRVVLDQVYNHTTDSALFRSSVLDRIVPGYYHRLGPSGGVETSTCCQNLATEHLMTEKLMVDSCVLWVRHYRVDGFRFDLMGHHSRHNLERVRAALDELRPETDGVDGRAVTLYGEGWNFGEVAGNARFFQAVQGQLDGTGIGTFNDRLRDAVRGGSVQDDDPRDEGGFATGGADPLHTDQLQVGLAGGLSDIAFRSAVDGRPVTGHSVPYGGSPTGYATEPDEVVNYVDAHDNETLWDTLVLKLAPDTPMAARIRRNTLALATVTLSQGISFWHAGAELLRSKSLDRNSYASGDWFNHLDYTQRDNGFARGLPPKPDNGRRWSAMVPLLSDPTLRPSPADIGLASGCALDLLRLRRDLPLLRLGRAEQILSKVTFPCSGTSGGRRDVVVMLIDDASDQQIDPDHSGVLVVLNASTDSVRQEVPGLAGQSWTLSDVQQEGVDPVTRDTRWDRAAGTVTVPGLTAAVLVRYR
ncbi:MAG: pullulanase-type alpha-1,6-glucosidase [Ornithinimicrobium sp.]|uniref:pullulanase-type alpha-1,6-glucosidase n=1 Tax=Ornithinimicrobium sp. TaxID=1977084 RepID=UPI0026DFC196|nr:pullulanase-type alpha-1,6-glucosidase [Ornithinimicrobium sp.]MDO5739049.1 pullulanase-type alpha-1,6-glucosidase [Ornithinimicrobium sp.]